MRNLLVREGNLTSAGKKSRAGKKAELAIKKGRADSHLRQSLY